MDRPARNDRVTRSDPMNTFEADTQKTNAEDEQHANHSDSARDATGLQRVRENRDALEDLAASDLPIAWAADRLLGIADDVDGDQDTADETGCDTDR
jgi:hypothetical protein